MTGGPATAQEPQFAPAATVGELMSDVIYPLSDELFYIMRSPPETDWEWTGIRRSALMLAESGNLLMIDGRSIRQDGWMAASKALVDVATRAWEASLEHDVEAIVALSPELEQSCRSCHEMYHPRYLQRRANPEN
jgi:hypothetical protein